MKTEEGKLKDKVRAFLKERKVASVSRPMPDAVGHYHMYVPGGYGEPALDFTGCYKGRYFAIETKAHGKTPTPRQDLIIESIIRAGGWVVADNMYNTLKIKLEDFFSLVDRFPIGFDLPK